MSQAERDHLRSRLLAELYDAVDGNRMGRTNLRNLVTDVDSGDRQLAGQWLVDNGYAEWAALGGTFSITNKGVNAVESARREATGAPGQRSQRDPFEGDGGFLLVVTAEQRAAVEAALSDVDRLDVEAKLDGDELASYEADRATLTAALKSPTPRKRVVFDALRGIARAVRDVGVEVSATAIAKALRLD